MKPTYEDIVKYHSQKTKLLVSIECYALPAEIQISAVIDGGAIFAFTNGFVNQWVKTDQVEVLHIFPPRELKERLWQLEQGEVKQAQRKDHERIDVAIHGGPRILTQKQLDKLAQDLGMSPAKKRKKKPKK